MHGIFVYYTIYIFSALAIGRVLFIARGIAELTVSQYIMLYYYIVTMAMLIA